MMSMLMEAVVLSFTVGCIMGAVVALHLRSGPERERAKATAKRVLD